MTPEQAALVQSTFASLAPRSSEVAEIFYDDLFELDPDLRELFTSDMSDQGRKLIQMLAMAVNALCKFYEIVPAVQQLGRRHIAYGVKGSDYETVGSALLSTLEKGLGDAFTPQVQEAWAAAYSKIAETMREGVEIEGDRVYGNAEKLSG